MGTNKKRTLIIGDVHGCYRELLELLKKANYQYKRDQLIFVGDLINKGPQSKEVLEFAYNHKAKIVIGNHELALVRYVNEHIINGSTLNGVQLSLGKDLNFWVDWIRELPSYLEYDDFSVVHAGKIPNKAFSEEDRQTLCTMRTWDQLNEDFQNPDNPLWFNFYHEDKLIIYGHNAVVGLIQRPNAIGLDTGCVYGRQLTLISLPTKQLFQVDAHRQYFPQY